MCVSTHHRTIFCAYAYNRPATVPPVTLPDAHLGAWRALLRVHAGVLGQVEEALGREGLPPLAWYDALWPLHEAGRPLRMGELSEGVLTIGRTGLSRLVDRLEAAGLLTRAQCGADRRGVEVGITRAGSALLRRMWPVYAGVLEERLAGALTDAEAAALRATLVRLEPQRRAASSAHALGGDR